MVYWESSTNHFETVSGKLGNLPAKSLAKSFKVSLKKPDIIGENLPSKIWLREALCENFWIKNLNETEKSSE